MNEDQFWSLISKSRRGAEDCEEQTERLIEFLEKLDPKEIQAFDRLLHRFLIKAYRWDLWAVAYIINGGCSDDGFHYFCGWLIAQGKSFFERALINPESVSRRVKPGEEVECEAIIGAAWEAYGKKAGQEMPSSEIRFPSNPKGRRWKEENLEKLYPKLCKKYW